MGENGIDVGALKAKLFTKVFEQGKQKLFEHVEDKPYCLIGCRYSLNEESVSGNIQMDHISVTSSTGNLLNFIKSLCYCNDEQ